MKKKITIALSQSIIMYPPTINLIEILLNNEYRVNLVACDTNKLPNIILTNNNFFAYNIPSISGNGFYKSWQRMKTRKKYLKKYVQISMQDSDILWTATADTVKDLGKMILKYKYIMQLMELISWESKNPGMIRIPLLRNLMRVKKLQFPIDKFARLAWKVVVPEENRAYIEKTWWHLSKVPSILPNKPYNLLTDSSMSIPSKTQLALNKIKKEKRKIILYLGVISPERKLDVFANAICKLGNRYCLYIIGKPSSYEDLQHLKKLKKKFKNVEYLGFFKAPQHLLFLKYCHIGLLPYYPNFKEDIYSSGLNVLYCAPNKIFEYSAFQLPMLGTNVLGLKEPFYKYNMGKTLDSSNVEEVINKINQIEENYDELKKGCLAFYKSVNLDRIVREIIEK